MVHGGVKEGQKLHGDGYRERPAPHDVYSPHAVASVAIHDVPITNAPLMFLGKEAMMAHHSNAPPAQWSDIKEVRGQESNFFVTMKKGDVLIRDPRVWHAGSPNVGTSIRFLPGFVISHKDW